MNKFVRRIKLILKEVVNFLGNIAVPFMSLFIAIVGLFPVPTEWLDGLKKAEYWLFQISGTAKDLEEMVAGNAIEDQKRAEEKTLKKAMKEQKRNVNLTKLD